MARPSTWNDLSENDQRGEEVIRWSTYSVMGFPTVAKHIIAATEAAAKAGLLATKDGIFEALSSDQLEDRLARAQERWDTLQRKYEVAADYPTKTSDLWEINNWARENGQPKIVVAEF